MEQNQTKDIKTKTWSYHNQVTLTDRNENHIIKLKRAKMRSHHHTIRYDPFSVSLPPFPPLLLNFYSFTLSTVFYSYPKGREGGVFVGKDEGAINKRNKKANRSDVLPLPPSHGKWWMEGVQQKSVGTFSWNFELHRHHKREKMMHRMITRSGWSNDHKHQAGGLAIEIEGRIRVSINPIIALSGPIPTEEHEKLLPFSFLLFFPLLLVSFFSFTYAVVS